MTPKSILGNAICLSLSLFAIGCSEDDTNKKEVITTDCVLTTVHRDSKTPNVITTLTLRDANGADKLRYLEKGTDAVIQEIKFKYNSAGQPIERKTFGPDQKLLSTTTITYWENGKIKQETTQQHVDDLHNNTNNKQISSFDDKGNITEYKNLNANDEIMNHLIYTNTYEGNLLTKSVRDDQKFTFDGYSVYTYDNGLNTTIVQRNTKDELTNKIVKEYDASSYLISLKNYSDGVTLGASEIYVRNENGVLLETQMFTASTLEVVHTYGYSCE
ncbi:hypothetical protein [Pseudochryseolinea flava]|uniref:DUF4595 domain-containing protein n=1 Tax=Pseudochryseolinea flava TaxID=2059302 RepID=A0A364XY20_9BACT|nr:hypothetical protein [Pseudochryseolinea flava]RAV99201.1 hypothetical protein DQQ10_20085 [Pseudochryseolinea flava]